MSIMDQELSKIELVQHVALVRKCTKVVKGGRRFTFSAIVIAGDLHGRVGIGYGSAPGAVEASEKAARNAKRSLVKISLKGSTIHYSIKASFDASSVLMKPAPSGTGVIAGGVVRTICELSGIKDIVVKSIGTSNIYNVILATMKALTSIESPRRIAAKRGKKISEILGKKIVNYSAVDLSSENEDVVNNE